MRRLLAGAAWAMLAGLLPSPIFATTLGVYGGNDPYNVVRFEKWLGCPVQQVLIFTAQDSWAHIAHPQWFIDRFALLSKPALWSIAMIPPGTSLQAAATGIYDTYYVAAARALARARPGVDGTIRIRIGWELNGDWFPWAAAGREHVFIAAYRHVVQSFRSVAQNFRFEWNINYGRTMDPAAAYPGDQYVDVIGMDFYWMPKYLGQDPILAFAKIRDHQYGLRYIQAFAAAHHKPVAFSEWGVQGDRAGPFIELVREWIATHDVLYHNYWDSDAAFSARLSGGRWPRSGAAFRHAFCRQAGQ